MTAGQEEECVNNETPGWNFHCPPNRCNYLKISFCFLLLEPSLRGNANVLTQISVYESLKWLPPSFGCKHKSFVSLTLRRAGYPSHGGTNGSFAHKKNKKYMAGLELCLQPEHGVGSQLLGDGAFALEEKAPNKPITHGLSKNTLE